MARPAVIWRPWVAAAGATVVAFAGGVLLGRSGHQPAPARVEPPAAPPASGTAPVSALPPAPPPPPLVQPAVLDRAELLGMVGAAASAYALGEPAPPGAEVGRPFEVRLPFGCSAPLVAQKKAPPNTRSLRVERDPKTQVIRILAEPQSWLGDPRLADLKEAGDLEAALGFPVRRPWLLAGRCPKAAEPAQPPSSGEAQDARVALVSLFRTGDSRIAERKVRSFEVTRRLAPEGEPTAPHEYQLVLRGRLADFGDGVPIRCASGDADAEPRCLVAIDLDQVRLEDPALHETLGEWSG